ncbi:DUF4037 domain-containing protein [Paenibacillus sp. TAB 01]|uniref:DUF4037 domain-containing protein n=1 Tax=Paenibacillus sp. TAB 01 TaxID=3368988 RepID=UPI0037532448
MSFIKGIELCRRFHTEIVEPVMAAACPGLPYSSALLGPGSEVIGYDTEMSTDHDWGPRVVLFLDPQQFGYGGQARLALQEHAPQTFYGFPVDPSRSVVTTVPQFIEACLAVHADEHMDIELLDWLTFPSQSLLEITEGAVYRDDRGGLTMLRRQLNYYPRDIWLYLMASCWQRIGQEEHLMLRAGYAGDELGSAIIASRLVRDIMNLCFLIERRYAPYPKWFGTAFKQLKSADALMPYLWSAQTAAAWRERECAFKHAYTCLSRIHNALGIAVKLPEDVSSFYDRPFQVMKGEDIARLIANQITDTEISRLAEQRLIGNIDLLTDNTDFRKISRGKSLGGGNLRNDLKRFFKPESN